MVTRRPANGGPTGEEPVEQPSENQEKAETPETPVNLDELLRTLRQQQYELDNAIRHSKASLTDQEGRQQRAKKQFAGLDRVAAELSRARADIGAAVADADRSVEAASPLVERLDDDVREAISKGLAAIDKEIGDAETAVVTETAKERDLAVERDRLAVDVAAKQAAHDEAEATLTALPAALKAAVAVLKAGRTGLDAACVGGRPVEAAVLVSEVTRAKERAQALSGSAHEKQLLENLRKSGGELTDAHGKLITAESGLIDQRALIAQRSARLTELTDGRAARIKELTAAPAAIREEAAEGA